MQFPRIANLSKGFSFREFRQLIIWSVLTAAFLIISLYGHTVGANNKLITEYIIMYAINSVIFFTLFRHYQTLGLTMLVFTIFFELSVFGYYFFSATSLNV